MVSDEKIIAAVLNSPSRGAAAELLGISTRQLFERLRKPRCAAMLSDAQTAILDDAIQRASRRLLAAVDTITAIMEDEGSGAQTRLNAAECLVRSFTKLHGLTADSGWFGL